MNQKWSREGSKYYGWADFKIFQEGHSPSSSFTVGSFFFAFLYLHSAVCFHVECVIRARLGDLNWWFEEKSKEKKNSCSKKWGKCRENKTMSTVECSRLGVFVLLFEDDFFQLVGRYFFILLFLVRILKLHGWGKVFERRGNEGIVYFIYTSYYEQGKCWSHLAWEHFHGALA